MGWQANYLNNETTSYHTARISKWVGTTINVTVIETNKLTWFNNFGLLEKFSYFHGAKMSVTVNTHMPRYNKTQKQNNNIRSHSGRHLHFQSIFFRIHCIIPSLSHIFLYQFPSYISIFSIALVMFDITHFSCQVIEFKPKYYNNI